MTNLNQKNFSNLNNNYVEIENQFILRMPSIKSENGTLKPHPATTALRDALANLKTSDETNEDPLKDRLFIELNPDTRKGRIKLDNEIFDARLVDLPCIIESLKTIDKKMFYKAGDISQMLICRTKDDPFSNSEDEKKEKSKKSTNQLDNFNRKYQWPHGLAPPLKNVRRKRFRKTAKKKIIDYAEIEKEVKQLFRADREAVKIDYEVCYVEADPDEDNDEPKINVKNDDFDSEYDENMDKDKSMNDGFKSKSMIEESNLSTEYVNDDTSSMPARKSNKLKSTDQDDTSNLNPSTNLNYDELSNDTSNLEAVSSKNNRTSFKNIFVKEVIGDLSSSDDERDEEDEDAEDEDEEEDEFDQDNGKKQKSRFISKSKSVTSGLFGDGDDSISNFDDTKIQDTTTQNDYENEESYSNIESTINKSKFNDTNEYGLGEDEDNDTDNDVNNKKNESAQIDEDTSSNFIKKSNDDEMSSSSLQGSTNKAELNTKLNKLMDELHRIQEERKRKEIEINPINNPVLKAHLSSRLNNLIDEENKKKAEIEELKELLN